MSLFSHVYTQIRKNVALIATCAERVKETGRTKYKYTNIQSLAVLLGTTEPWMQHITAALLWILLSQGYNLA